MRGVGAWCPRVRFTDAAEHVGAAPSLGILCPVDEVLPV